MLSVFGSAEDTQTSFSLLGADHINNPFNYGRDLDAIILSEIYEYSLAVPKTSPGIGIPHLQAFKLQHATLLAQYGYKSEAQKFCEAIASTIKAMPRSPLFNASFLDKLDDLNKRLQQTPKDSSGSWMSKPSLDSLSGSMWSTFNRFVAGDDETQKPKEDVGVESGPFAKLAGNTPGMSRNHSSSDLHGGFQPPMYGHPSGPYDQSSLAPANKTAAYQSGGGGRYDPASSGAPASGAGRYAPRGVAGASAHHADGHNSPYSSSPLAGGNWPGRSSQDQGSRYAPSPAAPGITAGGGYEQHNSMYPGSGASSYEPQMANPYAPAANIPNYTSAPAQDIGYPGAAPATEQQIANPESQSGVSSFDIHPAAPSDNALATEDASNQAGGYQPYGYEPPADGFQPYVPSPDPSDDEGDGKKKPKKKSFMDDDEDFMKAGPSSSSAGDDAKRKKQQEEEENRKMVAEIAEREKKAAEEAKSE